MKSIQQSSLLGYFVRRSESSKADREEETGTAARTQSVKSGVLASGAGEAHQDSCNRVGEHTFLATPLGPSDRGWLRLGASEDSPPSFVTPASDYGSRKRPRLTVGEEPRAASPLSGAGSSRLVPWCSRAAAAELESGPEPARCVVNIEARGLLSESATPKRTHGPQTYVKSSANGSAAVDEWSAQHPWSVHVRDSAGRSPTDPHYDPSTVFVPPEAERKMTPFQLQFWKIKRNYYDTVLLFKKGKFYECYDIDADIGHRVLQLNYTSIGRADMRCVGVPESAFYRHAIRLVDAGYRVGRVEQVESVLAAKANSNKVCDRRLVKILTKGTVVDEAGDDVFEEPRYLMIVVEGDRVPGTETIPLGICYLCVATAAVHLGVLHTSRERFTELEALLVRVRPREVILDFSSERLEFLVRSCAAPDVQVHRRTLRDVPPNASLVAKLSAICSDVLALRACQGAASFLDELLIADQVFPLGNFYSLHDMAPTELYERLELDAAAMEGLELFRTSADFNKDGSVFGFLDRCATNMGRRYLRRWLCHPFRDVARICDRLDAIEDIHQMLTSLSGANEMESAEEQHQQHLFSCLRSLPDIERSLVRIHALAVDRHGAVMFDDTNQRKVRDFLRILDGLATAVELVGRIRAIAAQAPESHRRSRRLRWLLSDGAVPLARIEATLGAFLDGQVFDADAARHTGVLRPRTDSHSLLATARCEKERIERELEEELAKVRHRLGRVPVRFYHRVQERYQIEIPADVRNIPDDFVLMSQTKQHRRYWTPTIRSLLTALNRVEEDIETAEAQFARTVFEQFDASYSLWLSVARMLGEFDALTSLANVSFEGAAGLPMTRPVFAEPLDRAASHEDVAAALCFKELWHPILALRRGPSQFVPNDFELDAAKHPSMVLTGPNMSGKSALLRQVSIAVILAQMGCYVPASSAYIRVPVDRLFTRIGARDRVMRAQSTFMVEMLEAAEVLNHATNRSLVVLDELGRGTSTFDGYAIAYSALWYLTFRTRCLTLFATHYHMLATEPLLRPAHHHHHHRSGDDDDDAVSVVFAHMGARVDTNAHEIAFLYRLRPGVAAHSRGIECARLAGIPEDVIQRAEFHARAFLQDTS